MIILCGKQIAASLFDILPSLHKTNGAKLKCGPNQPLYMFRYDAPIMCVCVCVHVYVVYEDTNLYNDIGMAGITRRR